jgi:integrase
MYWDKLTPGFGLRVSAPRPGSREGRKTWVAMGRVDGKPVMTTLGTLAHIPKVEQARQAAREALLAMKAGTKPLQERRAKAALRKAAAEQKAAVERETIEGRFGAVAERFLVEHIDRKRPKYATEVRRIFRHDILPRWGERPIRSITKADVNDLLDAKARTRELPRKGTDGGATLQANRTLTRLRTFFSWAAANDFVAADPTAGVLQRGKERARDRVLDDDEIIWFWRAADAVGWPFGPIFELLLLTAQRESEVAGMRWSELDLVDKRTWTIPRERTKSDRGHLVYLSALACEILGGLPRLGDVVFTFDGHVPVSGFGRAKGKLDVLMAAYGGASLPSWVIHDLRRTATTIMARLKVPPHIADKILNHTGGAIRGVAAVYNRYEYLDERKAALEALGRFVENLVRPTPSNVIPLIVAS